jgi:hypothetical protein
MPKLHEVGVREPYTDERVRIGLAAASVLKGVRSMGNPLVSYYFEMAWTAYYQSMDEKTQSQIAQGLEDAGR